MSNSTVQLDDGLIDDLVSGNLHGTQYSNTLRLLEAQPERWRDCALAFLHEQALVQDLSAMAQDDVDWDTASLEIAGRVENRTVEKEVVEQPSMNHVSIANAVTAERLKNSHRRLQWMHKLTMIAALLLISFTIGWYGSGLHQAVTHTSQTEVAREDFALDTQTSDSTRNVRDLYRNGDTLWAGSLPLADSRFIPVDRTMPAVLRELERRGMVQIESFDALVRMNLGDGSSGLVPVQQYRVKPINFSY